MQRSSNRIGALAAALAKAQAEIENPPKSLTATIESPFPREGSRSFRYAPLAAGLDVVRKCLAQHEIATVQATAIDRDSGLIRLTTTLVHASGEWMASDWPVCPVSETAAPHRMGTALTYARRYALFTLVGIAGEDDLDAPDLAVTAGPPGAQNGSSVLRERPEALASAARQPLPALGRRARTERPRPASLPSKASADLRDQLISELESMTEPEALALWAQRALPLKNQLSISDAQAVEAAFDVRLNQRGELGLAGAKNRETNGQARGQLDPSTSTTITIIKPVRERDRDHLRFVASQPCLVCGRTPSDAHHLRFAEPRAMARKVSDRFAVPICRLHHRELHRRGNERAWWQSQGIDPLVVAADLWRRKHAIEPAAAGLTGIGPDELNEIANGAIVAGPHQNDETKPILGREAE
jgi:hypothetical protein